jgi:hypothetical protein
MIKEKITNSDFSKIYNIYRIKFYALVILIHVDSFINNLIRQSCVTTLKKKDTFLHRNNSIWLKISRLLTIIN